MFSLSQMCVPAKLRTRVVRGSNLNTTSMIDGCHSVTNFLKVNNIHKKYFYENTLLDPNTSCCMFFIINCITKANGKGKLLSLMCKKYALWQPPWHRSWRKSWLSRHQRPIRTSFSIFWWHIYSFVSFLFFSFLFLVLYWIQLFMLIVFWRWICLNAQFIREGEGGGGGGSGRG